MHGLLDLDVTEANRLLAIHSPALSLTAFVVASVARAAAAHPDPLLPELARTTRFTPTCRCQHDRGGRHGAGLVTVGARVEDLLDRTAMVTAHVHIHWLDLSLLLSHKGLRYTGAGAGVGSGRAPDVVSSFFTLSTIR